MERLHEARYLQGLKDWLAGDYAWHARTTRYRPGAWRHKRPHPHVVSARPHGLGTAAADLPRLLRQDPGDRVDTGVHPDEPRSRVHRSHQATGQAPVPARRRIVSMSSGGGAMLIILVSSSKTVIVVSLPARHQNTRGERRPGPSS